MPEGTKVDDCYEKLRKEGKTEGSAAAICQSSTHESLHTGKPLRKSLNPPKTKCSKLFESGCSCNKCQS